MVVWSKSRGGDCLLAVAVVGGGETGVGKGKNWEGAVQDYAHRRTQVATAGNTMTARVVVRHRCQNVWSSVGKKAALDLAQVTVRNNSH
jgi:NADH dehydrogenase FAD-containing subunit